MKELKQQSIIQTYYPIRTYKPKKRWTIAQARPEKLQVMQNDSTEAAYHRVLKLAKTFMQPGEVYYERDHKQDSSERLFGMHSFVAPHFSCSLFCELDNVYHVAYTFNDCVYKAEIEKAFRAYPLDRTATERQLTVDYTTAFYESVLQIHDSKYIHTL